MGDWRSRSSGSLTPRLLGGVSPQHGRHHGACDKDLRAPDSWVIAIKVLSDGNPPKIPWMGTLSGIRHPLFSAMQPDRPRSVDRERRASWSATVRRIVPSIGSPFWEGPGVFG